MIYTIQKGRCIIIITNEFVVIPEAKPRDNHTQFNELVMLSAYTYTFVWFFFLIINLAVELTRQKAANSLLWHQCSILAHSTCGA